MANIIGIIIAVLLAIYAIKRALDGNKAAEQNRLKGSEFLQNNMTQEGVIQTSSGLQILTLEEGSGASPAATDKVDVHYHGTLLDGSVFDSSVQRGQSISFGLNQVIPGWTEGLQLMKSGGKSRLFIPADLAYGNRAAGTIPPGSLLIFDVELISVIGS